MKYMGAQEAWQFRSFNDFLILAIYCNYCIDMALKRAKCDLNGVKIAIFAINRKNHPAAGNSASSVTRLSCNSLFSTGPKLDSFCAKHIYFWFKPPLSYSTKPWLRFWSHSLLQTDFTSDCTGRI